MAVDNFFSLSMSNGIASGAPYGTPNPASMVALTNPWYDFGAMSTDGLTENLGQTRTEFKRWGSISPFQAVLTDVKHSFDVTFLESNPAVLGLYYRTGTTPTPTGAGTNEVQTIAISGSPTGGTFSLTYGGQTTAPLAYNAATSAVQTALQGLSSIGASNVTVTGTAGVSYVVTFVAALAATNVPNIVAVGAFTGGTTPAVTVTATTGGASGQLINITDDTTGVRDVRAFTFDMLQGTNHIRFYVPQGEVTDVKNPVYKTDSLIEYGVTITAYPTSSGIAVQRQFLLDAVVYGL
jgi:hypothetical protein